MPQHYTLGGFNRIQCFSGFLTFKNKANIMKIQLVLCFNSMKKLFYSNIEQTVPVYSKLGQI